jgi:hypothetical protein
MIRHGKKVVGVFVRFHCAASTKVASVRRAI